jgi:hypothetical protein
MWTDYFVEAIAGARCVVQSDGRPIVLYPIAVGENIIIELTTDVNKLPFQITFTSMNEERVYGYAGTKSLAVKLAKEVADLRLNSMRELVVTPY